MTPGPRFLNICAGDRVFPGWVSTDIAPTDPRILPVDATSLPYADATVDCVMMSHGLTNLSRQPDGWWRCFTEVYRVLRPGGWFRIDDAPKRWYDPRFPLTQPIEPGFEAQAQPRELITRMLYDAGFAEPLVTFRKGTDIPEFLSITFTYTKKDLEQLHRGLVDNRAWHESFAIECVKPGEMHNPDRS